MGGARRIKDIEVPEECKKYDGQYTLVLSEQSEAQGGISEIEVTDGFFETKITACDESLLTATGLINESGDLNLLVATHDGKKELIRGRATVYEDGLFDGKYDYLECDENCRGLINGACLECPNLGVKNELTQAVGCFS